MLQLNEEEMKRNRGRIQWQGEGENRWRGDLGNCGDCNHQLTMIARGENMEATYFLSSEIKKEDNQREGNKKLMEGEGY